MTQSAAEQRIPEQKKINAVAYRSDSQKDKEIGEGELNRINEVASSQHKKIEYGLDDSDLDGV